MRPSFKYLLSLCFGLVSLLFGTIAHATDIRIGIAPNELTIQMGKDGLPKTIAPNLIFFNEEPSQINVVESSHTPHAPEALFATSTSIEAFTENVAFPITFVPSSTVATGTYDYTWKFRFKTEATNIEMILALKIHLNYLDQEAGIKEPYIWYPIGTTYPSPVTSVSTPKYLWLQRQQTTAYLPSTITSSYVRRISNLTSTGTLYGLPEGELMTTSTNIINPGENVRKLLLPPLGIGRYHATYQLLDKTSQPTTIIVTPTYLEMGIAFIGLDSIILLFVLWGQKRKHRKTNTSSL